MSQMLLSSLRNVAVKSRDMRQSRGDSCNDCQSVREAQMLVARTSLKLLRVESSSPTEHAWYI